MVLVFLLFAITCFSSSNNGATGDSTHNPSGTSGSAPPPSQSFGATEYAKNSRKKDNTSSSDRTFTGQYGRGNYGAERPPNNGANTKNSNK